MSVETVTSAESVKPQERVTALMARSFESRQAGKLAEAAENLELALAEARKTPYDIEFQTRIQLGITLADVYVELGDLKRASEMLVSEVAFAERVSQVIQATGTPSQKRSATGGYLQVRDRSIQLRLIGLEAPEIDVKDWLIGGVSSLAELRGRVVLLEFWATWCKPCQEMFPKLKKLHEHESSNGLEIIALTRHYMAYGGTEESKLEERQLMQGIVDQHQALFHVGIADDERLQGVFGANGLPTLVLIDRNGIIQYIGPGEDDVTFNKKLKQALSA
jgi:thiol-disulfide isomerase/thioredoxin